MQKTRFFSHYCVLSFCVFILSNIDTALPAATPPLAIPEDVLTTPWHVAAATGNVDAIRQLLTDSSSKRTELTIKSFVSNEAMTPLQAAAACCPLDADAETVARYAEVVHLLCKELCKQDKVITESSPWLLHYVNHAPIAIAIIDTLQTEGKHKSYCDVIGFDALSGHTSLHAAAAKGNWEVFCIIASWDDFQHLNSLNYQHQTPLDLAIKHRRKDCVAQMRTTFNVKRGPKSCRCCIAP